MIPRNRIKTIEDVFEDVVEGEFRRGDPNRTRLLFAPSARSLKVAQGYFSIYEVFFPTLAFGVTDFAAIAAGISLFSFVPDKLPYLAPKVTPLPLSTFDAGGGGLYINTAAGDRDGVGIVYGVGTYGSENAALTVGLGWRFARGELENEPILLIGGELRSAGIKLITENWIPPNSDVVFVSLGVWFFGENLAADFGLIHPACTDIRGFPFIPSIGFAYNFGPAR